MRPAQLSKLIVGVLDQFKAVDIRVMDVRGMTTITDFMIIASGKSDRQVKALADKVIETAKERGIAPLGIEGQREGEWILVDLGDAVVHVMRPVVRQFYQLEKLWTRLDQRLSAS
ncbi:MAG: ribosome silencing factor [Gammaproteobacteria bacterium]|nr:ribosome silencing factor [Gammaproteobacteria bacterium]MCI0590763.1 ribosome silencing factor [Gammaproteobacteria bacterium]